MYKPHVAATKNIPGMYIIPAIYFLNVFCQLMKFTCMYVTMHVCHL